MDDQSLDPATSAAPDDQAGTSTAGSADASTSTLNDGQHKWASEFCGINTRGDASGNAGDNSATSDSSSGGFWVRCRVPRAR